MSVNIRIAFSENFKHDPKKLMGILRQSAKLRSQMFSGPPGNLFSIFRMVCLLHHFYIYVITCVYSYMEYTRNQEKLIKPKKTQ